MKRKTSLILAFICIMSACSKNLENELSPNITTSKDTATISPIGEFEIIDDIKHTVSSATASSYQNGEEIKNSYDGKLNTMWHTAWNNPNAFPYIITYQLTDADQLDYILYYPRTDGVNGLFGIVDIEVTTKENPSFVKVVNDFNCQESSNPTEIILPKSIKNPVSVRITIKSGYGGFASCSEMLFYKKAEGNSAVNTIIPVYKTGYTEPAQYHNYVQNGIMEIVYNQNVAMQGKVFFTFGKIGLARIQLKIRNETAGKIIKVKLGDTTKSVSVKETIGQEWITVIDSFEVNDIQNYSVLEIENQNSGNVYIESVRIIGSPSEGITYLNHPENRRNSASVHLSYPTSASDIEWFYNEVTIPHEMDPYHTFYMVTGYTKGYAGIQVREHSGPASSRIIIFSCWNSGESGDPETLARVVKYNEENVIVQSFGGEGTGAKTYREYDWETGKTYSFLLKGWTEGTDTYYALFWKEKDATNWNYQATIKSPKNGEFLNNFYSFVENYVGSDGQYLRKANFANQWMKRQNSGWEQITNARFTEDGNAKYRGDIGASITNNGYYLWNGGFISGEGTVGEILRRNLTNASEIPVTDNILQELSRIAKP